MKVPLLLLLLSAAAGLGLGEAGWALSLASPAFAWPEMSRQAFWACGAGLALVAGLLQALAWNFAFGLHPRWGLRAGLAFSLPGLAGWAWRLALSLPIPAPHHLPSRKLQIFLAALAVGGLALSLAAGLLALAWHRALLKAPGRGLGLRLAGTAWVFYLLCGAWTAGWHLTGDGPHYLLEAHSLASDRDLDLANQYARADWRLFYERQLKPQEAPQAGGGHYSEHKPLVPLALAPAYAALGLAGAQWSVAGLAALASALFFLLLLRLGFGGAAAVLGWALFSFSAPWWVHSQVFLVELSGGLLFLAAWCSLRGALPRWAAWAAPAALVWLGLRFYVPALALAALAWRRWRDARALIFWAMSLAGGFLLNYAHFGALSPVAAYDQKQMGMATLFQPWRMGRFASGLMIDQEFGWLPFAPAFLLCFSGMALWWREKKDFFWELALPAAAYISLVASFPWWYSDMAPNRYLVALTPLFALGAMRAWAQGRARGPLLALFLANFAWGLGMAVLPWLCYSKIDGRNWILKIMSSALGHDLTRYFPSFMIEKPLSYLWVLAVLAAALAFHRSLSPKPLTNP